MNFETKVIEQKGKKNKAVGGERLGIVNTVCIGT